MTAMASGTFKYGAQVRANGIRQHYLRYGESNGADGRRDALIVVPGITSPAITWGFVGERLGRRFETYVLDVRGRGLSESSTTLDYGLDAQAADVIFLARTLGLERWAIVGHSMGARIAIRAAAREPAGLTRLVLVDPPVSGPGRRPYPATLSWYVDSIAEAAQGMDVDAMRRYCPTWTEAQLQLRAEWLHTCDERAVRASFDSFHQDDVHADLPRLKVPSLLITAERGDVVRPQDVAELQSLAPGMQAVRVPGAGHMIPWDNEDGFHEAFGSFLDIPLEA